MERSEVWCIGRFGLRWHGFCACAPIKQTLGDGLWVMGFGKREGFSKERYGGEANTI